MLPRPVLLHMLLAACAVAFSPPQMPQSLGTDTNAAEVSRRGWLESTAAVAVTASSLLVSPPSASAATADLVDFKDEVCKFSLKVPGDWERSEQSLPDRRKIVLWLPPNGDKKTLMFVAYTPIRDDFTSLGSFGSVDQVAQMTILPKGKMMGEENTSKMLSSESKKGAYFFDYLQKVPTQPETHFRTIFTLSNGATGGAGAVLVSITAQAPEADYEAIKPMFDEIIASYK